MCVCLRVCVCVHTRLWGDHGQSCLELAKVCLINATATGTEILKNLILPGTIYVWQSTDLINTYWPPSDLIFAIYIYLVIVELVDISSYFSGVLITLYTLSWTLSVSCIMDT